MTDSDISRSNRSAPNNLPEPRHAIRHELRGNEDAVDAIWTIADVPPGGMNCGELHIALGRSGNVKGRLTCGIWRDRQWRRGAEQQQVRDTGAGADPAFVGRSLVSSQDGVAAGRSANGGGVEQG